MQHDVPQLLGLLFVILSVARIAGILSRWFGQPAVLGELLAGIVIGPSLFQLIDPQDEVLRLLAQVGVVLLLFQIGMETDLRKLIAVWGPACAVAVAGMLLPLLMGYALCRAFGFEHSAAIATGAVLSVTGIGVTARILSDLGRLDDVESRIVLGAAVIDDMVGLIVLAVVGTTIEGREVTVGSVVLMAAIAMGFLAGTLWLGARMIPPLVQRMTQLDLPGSAPIMAVIVAFGFSWMAAAVGSAMIIGAFAAGLLLRRSPQARDIEEGFLPLGRFFVPIFFVMVGAAVNLRMLNPTTSDSREFLLTTGLLFVVAVIGKLGAGYVPFWFSCRKSVIGWAMVPRGAVGLVFAQFGLSRGVLDERLFSALTLMVILTTVVAPPIIRLLLPRRDQRADTGRSGAGALVSEP
ncbi:MAG: cation:proton antiporter [Planctomycetota bacterium]|nr:MAG: cation:proton antiporter [Planctomycetota bacterium]REJ90634.1 MAG: cation:proton antiporter [Planctomycetota bacterium]REK24802.1 MAG: cation:proton antiporter [Planctomycetota bacterium]REK38831.1 MAG: cation:proton antiporter [Planctomycetota bacterium]